MIFTRISHRRCHLTLSVHTPYLVKVSGEHTAAVYQTSLSMVSIRSVYIAVSA